MAKRKKSKNKFEFGIDFQELILQYTVTDHKGYKVLDLYEDSYFTLITHTTIAYALKKYYKKYKRVPDEPYLREYLRTMYATSQFDDLLEEDRKSISDLIAKIYSKPVPSTKEIIEKCLTFARYVRFKDELEKIDINNYESYESAIGKLKDANNIGFELEADYGVFLVDGIKDRAHKRDITTSVHPTPLVQLNKLLNSGGTTTGSVFVVMSKEKRFKTGFMINIARGYMRMRKKGVYIDLENGEVALVTRNEQSLLNEEQDKVTSGDSDNRLIKLLRKYRRLGAELVIKKFPSLQTTTDHIQKWLDKLKEDYGFVPDFAIVDYGMLLGSTTGKSEEFNRISDAHLDLKNFAAHNNLECVWTAAHITREGDKRTGTKYKSTDIAKCIDIPKHVDAILGLQESEEELEAGVMRLEVIEQRNGMRDGNCLLWVDIPRQRMREFNRREIQSYKEQLGIDEKTLNKKPKKESDL